MSRMGHDVWIITSKYGRERESEGHIIRLGTGWAAPANGSVGRVTLGLRFKHQARDVLEEQRFDILHFHEPLVPFLSPTMLDASDTVNIATFHAFGGFSPSYWIGAKFAGRLADKLDGRIAVSGAARHFISRYFPGEYRIIPNGVDLERFQTAEPYEELRDGTLNILFVGRLEERKGLTHLLQAYHRLRKRRVDARLLVIGGGPKLREYKRFVGLRGIRDVEFLGRVSDEQKVRYFASADIYCAPNTGQESFGIVLLEAMAAGRADRRLRHPRLQARRRAQRAGHPRRAAQPTRAGRRALHPRPRSRHAPRHGRGWPPARSGVQLGPRDRADRRLLLRDPRARARRRADRQSGGYTAGRMHAVRSSRGRRQAVERSVTAKPTDSYRPSAPGRVVGVDAEDGIGHSALAEEVERAHDEVAGQPAAAPRTTGEDAVQPAPPQARAPRSPRGRWRSAPRRRSRRRPTRRGTWSGRTPATLASAGSSPPSRRGRPSGRGTPRGPRPRGPTPDRRTSAGARGPPEAARSRAAHRRSTAPCRRTSAPARSRTAPPARCPRRCA